MQSFHRDSRESRPWLEPQTLPEIFITPIEGEGGTGPHLGCGLQGMFLRSWRSVYWSWLAHSHHHVKSHNYITGGSDPISRKIRPNISKHNVLQYKTIWMEIILMVLSRISILFFPYFRFWIPWFQCMPFHNLSFTILLSCNSIPPLKLGESHSRRG